MANRTDVHRPTALVTEDYEYEGAYYLGSSDCPAYSYVYCAADPAEVALKNAGGAGLASAFRENRLEWGGVYGEDDSRCDHCGAHISYGAVLHHKPTGKHIHVGETCLDNRFTLATPEFQRLRKQAQLDRAAQAIKAKWAQFKEDHPADWDGLAASANSFIVDVLRKGRKYGDLSEKQFAAIVKAHARDTAPAPEAEKTVDVPEGTLTIEGTIVSVKVQDGYYGRTLKCLVKVETPEGIYKVWGSVPSALGSAITDYSQSVRRANGSVDAPTYRTGLRVRFTASVERSEKDSSFGFFKRPRKAEVVA